MSATSKPRWGDAPILFIDAYDSFANNIVALLECELQQNVVKVFIDHQVPDFPAFVRQFSAIVIGPGPGTPESARDTGMINEVWALPDASLLPVLGICLGFQSLVLNYGGFITRLPHPRHGIETLVESDGKSIFRGLRKFSVVQYHSLHAVLDNQRPSEYAPQSVDPGDKTACTTELLPLAWEFEVAENPTHIIHADIDQASAELNGISNPNRILMAVAHVSKPFFGVQFHPESICSSPEARQLLWNWWEEAQRWSRQQPDESRLSYERPATSLSRPFSSPLDDHNRNMDAALFNDDLPWLTSPPLQSASVNSSTAGKVEFVPYSNKTIPALSHTVPSIVSSLQLISDDEEAVILDTARPIHGVRTRSIIGCIDDSTLHVTYTVASHTIGLRRGPVAWTQSLGPYSGSIFGFLKAFMGHHLLHPAQKGKDSNVFSGGLVGFVDYEACLETISVRPPVTPGHRANVHFVFVERSILLDTNNQEIVVQSIRKDDEAWIEATASLLSPQAAKNMTRGESTAEATTEVGSSSPRNSSVTSQVISSSPDTLPESINDEKHDIDDFQLDKALASLPNIQLPQEKTYRERISQCQRELCAGNSYELCLTDQTLIQVPVHGFHHKSSWELYCQLRTINPAPYAAYMRLGSLTLMSSSPERFMSWSRPSTVHKGQHMEEDKVDQPLTSVCQFRPIKGTAKKVAISEDGSRCTVSLEEATAILSSQKERAENLMIVDLIRHDLHGVVGQSNVDVPQLMVIEEYEHVYQLVSVIEGRLSQPPLSCAYKSKRPLSLTMTASSHNVSAFHGGSNSVDEPKTGIDVLACSLPPGSMTGAPKKRSCELLTGIEEGRPRSVYAGVLGYMDVGGGGDFSVVIRTVFRWDDESATDGGSDTWRVGAGGAITVLSTETGEWEEMRAKLSSVLGLFDTYF